MVARGCRAQREWRELVNERKPASGRQLRALHELNQRTNSVARFYTAVKCEKSRAPLYKLRKNKRRPAAELAAKKCATMTPKICVWIFQIFALYRWLLLMRRRVGTMRGGRGRVSADRRARQEAKSGKQPVLSVQPRRVPAAHSRPQRSLQTRRFVTRVSARVSARISSMTATSKN